MGPFRQIACAYRRLPTALANAPRYEWHLTASSLSSKTILLNGKQLELTNENALPEMPPVSGGTAEVALEGYSYGFVLVEDSRQAYAACHQSP